MCGLVCEDAAGRLDAVDPGHLQVHQDDVRLQLVAASAIASSPSSASPTSSRSGAAPAGRAARRGRAGGRRRSAPGWAPWLVLPVRSVVRRSAQGSTARDAGAAGRPRAIASVPPSSAARSRIEDRPTPGTGSARAPPVVGDLQRQHASRFDPARAGRCRCWRWRGCRRWSAPPARCGRRPPRRRRAAAAASLGGVDADLKPPAVLMVGVHPQRADQAEVVQRRRAQPVDQAADVGDRVLGLLASAR